MDVDRIELSFLEQPPQTDQLPSAVDLLLKDATESCANNKETAPIGCYLPTCSICLRRLRCVSALLSNSNSQQQGSDIAVGRSFAYNCSLSSASNQFHSEDAAIYASSSSSAASREISTKVKVRCVVCFIYYSAQQQQEKASGSNPLDAKGIPASTSLSYCEACGLHENIWVCLLCGYTGCGRYTSMHAHLHYQTSHTYHQWALELVSGRIWDYKLDSFVHFEDTSAAYGDFMSSTFSRLTNLNVYGDFNVSSVRELQNQQASIESLMMPGAEDISARKMLVSRATLENSSLQSNSILPGEINDKMNKVAMEYERRIESQLAEQQLHYEKLLARETMRAMEYSYRLINGESASESSQVFESESANNAATVASCISSFDREAIDRQLYEIEYIKLESTSVEAEHAYLSEELKAVTESNRKIMHNCDVLLRKQAKLKDIEQALVEKEAATRQGYSDKVRSRLRILTGILSISLHFMAPIHRCWSWSSRCMT